MPILLMCAVTAATFKGADVTAVLQGWRELAKGGPLADEIKAFCDSVEAALGAPGSECVNAAANHSDDWVRWTHALRLLRESKPEPNSLLVATVFLSFSRWSTIKFSWFTETAAMIDREISLKWVGACEQRFAYSMPALFIPEIRALAGNVDGTVAHIAKIALVAVPALRVDIPNSVLDDIRRVANERGPVSA